MKLLGQEDINGDDQKDEHTNGTMEEIDDISAIISSANNEDDNEIPVCLI